MSLALSVILSICIGVFVGILSGLLGIGGGTILVPTFHLVFGMSAIRSTATSLFTIILTSISGSAAHIRNKTCIIWVGVFAGVGGAIMSPLGVWLASFSPDWLVMFAAAVVIAYSSFTMFKKAFVLRRQLKDKTSENCETPSVDKALDNTVNDHCKLSLKTALVSACIGLAAGLVSGYVGVGGGFLMVPLFMSLLNLPMRVVSGSSLIAVMILAIPGTITQAFLGNVDWICGLSVAIGSIPGSILGAKLIKRLPELTLRFIFGIVLLVAATLLVLNP